MFEVLKIGDEYFTYLVNCKSPKACTIVLRGASKDILKEVCRIVKYDRVVVYVLEMAVVSCRLSCTRVVD